MSDLISREDAITAVTIAVLADKDEIEALKAIPSVQVNGDLISRQDAIEAVGEWMQKEFGYLDLNRAERLIDKIEALPSADAVSMEEHIKELNDLAVEWKAKFAKAEKITDEIYDETMAKVAKECEECKERLRNIRPSAEAEPKWNCTANFVAEQLEKLKDMTDEERIKLLHILFPSADAEPSLKAIKRQIDEHWYLDPPSAESKDDLISRQWLLDLYATPKDGDDVEWKVPLEVVRQNILDAPSAEAEPTVIRSKTLMPTKDFKEWAKRVRETNPNAVVIPCDAEVVYSEAVQIPITLEKRYPESKDEDITDAFMRGYLAGRSSAEAVQGWIPVEEQPPVFPCLVCDANGNQPSVPLGIVTITDEEHGEWHIDGRLWDSPQVFVEGEWGSQLGYGNRIIAWMPLPKPYREESEVEE